MKKQVFIFRGSPASGKGTITAEFIKQIPGKVVYLELDTFRWGFHLYNRVVADVSDAEHQLAYKNFLCLLENYLQDGCYTIVAEGLFARDKASPHGNMQDIISICEKYGYDAKQILLSADYDILWSRNLKREYSVPEDEFQMLYKHVMNEQSDNEIKINVGEKSVEQSVSILSALLK